MSNLKLSPNHCLRDPKSGLEGGLEKERGREGKGQREREILRKGAFLLFSSVSCGPSRVRASGFRQR